MDTGARPTKAPSSKKQISLFLSTIGSQILHNRWGGQALISLYISVLSGIVLALQYRVATPFYSTVTIDLVIPYGYFWRALHYYSSQAFFLLLLGHIAAIILKEKKESQKAPPQFSRLAWIRLVLSFPVSVLLLFTGYVLRADGTGQAAGAIAEHICNSIPFIGTAFNQLFFDLSNSGVNKIYVHHVAGLMIFGAYTLWPHLKRYPARWKNHPLVIILIFIASVFLACPLEVEKVGITYIAGPWFFLGLQELLRYLPSFVAGVLMPLFPLLLILWLPTNKSPKLRQYILYLVSIWLLVYTVLTLVAWLRKFPHILPL